MKFSVVDIEYPLDRIWEEFLLKNMISSLTTVCWSLVQVSLNVNQYLTMGIIYGRGSFAIPFWGPFVTGDHLRYCTVKHCLGTFEGEISQG